MLIPLRILYLLPKHLICLDQFVLLLLHLEDLMILVLGNGLKFLEFLLNLHLYSFLMSFGFQFAVFEFLFYVDLIDFDLYSSHLDDIILLQQVVLFPF